MYVHMTDSELQLYGDCQISPLVMLMLIIAKPNTCLNIVSYIRKCIVTIFSNYAFIAMQHHTSFLYMDYKTVPVTHFKCAISVNIKAKSDAIVMQTMSR